MAAKESAKKKGADTKPAPKKTAVMTVGERIVEVRRRMGVIEKDGFNQQSKFKYQSIDAIQAALKGLMDEVGLILYPEDSEDQYDHLEKGASARTKVAWVFEAVETGEKRTMKSWGEGRDSYDKAVNKAVTSSKKNLLKTVFLVNDHEADPDDDSPPASPPKAKPKVSAPEAAPKGGLQASDTARLKKVGQERLEELGIENAWDLYGVIGAALEIEREKLGEIASTFKAVEMPKLIEKIRAWAPPAADKF